MDFSLVSVAAIDRVTDRIGRDLRIVLGGVATFPCVAAQSAAHLTGRDLTARAIADAVEAAVDKAKSLPGNGYKVDLMKAPVEKTLTSIVKAQIGRPI